MLIKNTKNYKHELEEIKEAIPSVKKAAFDYNKRFSYQIEAKKPIKTFLPNNSEKKAKVT